MSDPTNFFGMPGDPALPPSFFQAVPVRSVPREMLVLQYELEGHLPPVNSVTDGTVALVKENRTAYEAGPTSWLSRGTFAGSNVHVVQHGADADHERPSQFSAVIWVGNVEPANAQDNDIWFDTGAA